MPLVKTTKALAVMEDIPKTALSTQADKVSQLSPNILTPELTVTAKETRQRLDIELQDTFM